MLIQLISGQIERTPKKEDILPDLLHELTTKMTFTPNTHRTIQLNPHTSSSVPVKSDGNGFLGLFATLSNGQKDILSSTNAPLYIGDIDMDELKKFHNFDEVQNSNSNVAKYLKLKNLLDSTKKQLRKKKTLSHSQASRNQLLQNRRLSIEEDPDDKISALQILVKNNIQESLRSQTGTGQMSAKYLVPHADNLNTYNSQVEKPGPISDQLQNLPFLMQDPNQYQSVMINPAANVDTRSLQSHTQNPLNNDMHSTLPFLDNSLPASPNPPLVLASLFNKDYLTPGAVYPAAPALKSVNQNIHTQSPSMQNSPVLTYPSPKQALNLNNLYGTSFVMPSNPQLSITNRIDSFPQSYLQPDGRPTSLSSADSYSQTQSDLGSKLMMAEDEQRSLAAQLAQLKQLEQNLKQNKYQPVNQVQSFLPEPKPTVSSVLTKSLSSFPMNFEDMLSTGLKLAEQSSHKTQNLQHSSHNMQSLQHSRKNLQHSSPSLQSQSVGQMIQPRSSPQSAWSSGPMPSVSHYSDNNRQTDFNPSKQISQKVVGSKPGYNMGQDKQLDEVHQNSIDSEQIHIIGPNCYIMSKNGFKYVGKAPNCDTVDKKKNIKEKGERRDRRQNGRSGSIWDSIKSMPLVNKFAKSFGIK